MLRPSHAVGISGMVMEIAVEQAQVVGLEQMRECQGLRRAVEQQTLRVGFWVFVVSHLSSTITCSAPLSGSHGMTSRKALIYLGFPASNRGTSVRGTSLPRCTDTPPCAQAA